MCGLGVVLEGKEKKFLVLRNMGNMETWMSSEGIGLSKKMLSLLCLRFWKNCSLGFWSMLESG